MDLKKESSRLEQRTLTLSLVCVVVIALGSLAWGLAIESDVVILNGVFSLVSLIGSVLYLTAARLVARPADRRFQYGYAHVEPMVNGVNGMLVLVICLYALINGVEGLRAGGSEVDAASVVWFGAVTGLICAAVGTYELWMGRRTGSQLLRNDAREWLIDAAFSLVTLVGFAALFVLEDPLRSIWARYADSALVALLALLFLPIPLGVVTRNARELLHMSSEDDEISGRVEVALQAIRNEHDIRSHTTHVAKVGRSHVIEVNIVVGPRFELQTVAEQDGLRQRIWSAVDRPIDAAWLTINFTADPRWA
ncbi:MAG TPA: cation diffusion facilitator family transporter [Steroidobacteraceae bacterium]|jgi:cation diffusion facilitator family transporter|nr:cation diffusion facilitator family transporter [Steroidobacteraceae bacterium]